MTSIEQALKAREARIERSKNSIKLAKFQKHTIVVTRALEDATGLHAKEIFRGSLNPHYELGAYTFKTRKELNEHLLDFLKGCYSPEKFDLEPVLNARNSNRRKAFDVDIEFLTRR